MHDEGKGQACGSTAGWRDCGYLSEHSARLGIATRRGHAAAAAAAASSSSAAAGMQANHAREKGVC